MEVRLIIADMGIVLELNTFLCRDAGHEGVNNELPGAEGGGI